MPGIIDANGKRAATRPPWSYPEGRLEFLCRKMCEAVGRDPNDFVPAAEGMCLTAPELEERRQLNLTISRHPVPTRIWRTMRGRAWDLLAGNEALMALFEAETKRLQEMQEGRADG